MSEKKIPRCFTCHEIVTFDDSRVGKNGRKIPLDPSTNQPHQCKKDYGYATPSQEEIREQGQQPHQEPYVIINQNPIGIEEEQTKKEPPGKVPRPTTAMYAIIEHESKKEALRLLTEYVNKYLSYGGQTYGVTYHTDTQDNYTQFFVSYAIPNNAVRKMESA